MDDPQKKREIDANSLKGSHSTAPSGDGKYNPAHEILQSIPPGNVHRLVEKFRRLGEQPFHTKPNSRLSSSRKLSGAMGAGRSYGSFKKKELLMSSRRRSDRSRKSRTTDEKWIFLTPCLFSPGEFDSCSVSVFQPTFDPRRLSGSLVHTKDTDNVSAGSLVHTKDTVNVNSGSLVHSEDSDSVTSGSLVHTKDSDNVNSGSLVHTKDSDNVNFGSLVHSKDSDNVNSGSLVHTKDSDNVNSGSLVHSKDSDNVDESGDLSISLSCEQDVSEIVVQIEYITIDSNEDYDNYMTVESKACTPKHAEEEKPYEEIGLAESSPCVNGKKLFDSWSKDSSTGELENYDTYYEEVNHDPNLQFFYHPELACLHSPLLLRKPKGKERHYEEISYATADCHSGDDNKHSKRTAMYVDKSDQDALDLITDGSVVEDPIYEEIEINPPLRIVRDQPSSASEETPVSESLRSQQNGLSSMSSVFDEEDDADSFDSFSSDSDSYIADQSDSPVEASAPSTHLSSSTSIEKQACQLKTNDFTITISPGPLELDSGSSNELYAHLPDVPGCCTQTLPHEDSSHVATYLECSLKLLSSEKTDGVACCHDDNDNTYEEYDFGLPKPTQQSTSSRTDSVQNRILCNDLRCKEGKISECESCRWSKQSTCSDDSSVYDSFSSSGENFEPATSDTQIHPEKTTETVNQLEKIKQEIVETERKYISRLRLINDYFQGALIAWNQDKNLIPPHVFRQMFLNIDVIYKLHSEYFLPELEECINNKTNKSIEDVFLKGADFLKLYAEYSFNFDSAMKTIELWKSKISEFNKAIQKIQQKSVCLSLSLEHHMLEPILRIPRYELLLTKYLEKLPEDSSEKEKSKKALKKVTAAASHCNDFFKSMEKYRKVLNIQQSLWNKIDLLTPSRELVLSGRMKVTQQLEQDEEKQLFLFNDTLLVCKMFPHGISPPHKLTLQLDIEGMQVLDRMKQGTTETFFVISKQGYLEMHPSSSDEKEKWISALQTVIKNRSALEATRKTVVVSRTPGIYRQKSTPGEQAPIWIRDPFANRCMQCNERFNAIRRRHHCRACGIVVCGTCSSKQARLAFDGFFQLHRICDKCYSEIQNSMEDAIDGTEQKTCSLTNIARFSKNDGVTSKSDDQKRQSVFFIFPPDEKSDYEQSIEEEKIAMLSSSLEAIIENNTEMESMKSS